MLRLFVIFSVIGIPFHSLAQAADANAGKTFFSQQCALCHSAEPGDGGGAQGPLLHDVFDREAGSSGFSYTSAMLESGLVWDSETLDRFLAAPASVVPGSSMVIPVQDDEARANVIAYFEALGNGTFEEAEPQFGGFGGGGFGPPPEAEEPAGDPDWKNDFPGRVHKVDLDSLPEPYETGSAFNFPQLVDQPEGAQLQLPEGFSVEVYATDLQGPRAMVLAPNGDIFLAETQSGRIKVLKPAADNSAPESITVFAQGMVQPLGMAFYPQGDNPEWLYVAEMNRVVRYPYQAGDTEAQGVPEIVISQLSPVGGGHYTRDLAFSRDGQRLFVSVGSQSNVAEQMAKKSLDEAIAWDTEHGTGAAWDMEENRAAVMVFTVGSEEQSARLFATGIRNCVGLTVQAETGDVWCTTNERDQLGDDLVPDYSTRVPEGSFFGWPWYYMGNNEDPRLAGERPDLEGKVSIPDVPFTAHSAAVDLEFYPYDQEGTSAFPAEYRGQGFAVLHGSWNRAHRTGHKLVHIPIENGQPTGEYVDFMVGFITPDSDTWGRPVAVVVAHDGSLLLSDDGANLIYRISYNN